MNNNNKIEACHRCPHAVDPGTYCTLAPNLTPPFANCPRITVRERHCSSCWYAPENGGQCIRHERLVVGLPCAEFTTIVPVILRREEAELPSAGKTPRIVHLFVDRIICLAAVFFSLERLDAFVPLFLVVYFLYETLLEVLTGRTMGKWLTGTLVVSRDNTLPTPGQIVLRNLCRFIPFEELSFLGGTGWHDAISRTKVVRAADWRHYSRTGEKYTIDSIAYEKGLE